LKWENEHKLGHTTVKGRVVYDRKPHMWTPRDILRVTRGVDTSMSGSDDLTWDIWLQIFLEILEKIKDRFPQIKILIDLYQYFYDLPLDLAAKTGIKLIKESEYTDLVKKVSLLEEEVATQSAVIAALQKTNTPPVA